MASSFLATTTGGGAGSSDGHRSPPKAPFPGSIRLLNDEQYRLFLATMGKNVHIR
jgi:hypothetical protein